MPLQARVKRQPRPRPIAAAVHSLPVAGQLPFADAEVPQSQVTLVARLPVHRKSPTDLVPSRLAQASACQQSTITGQQQQQQQWAPPPACSSPALNSGGSAPGQHLRTVWVSPAHVYEARLSRPASKQQLLHTPQPPAGRRSVAETSPCELDLPLSELRLRRLRTGAAQSQQATTSFAAAQQASATALHPMQPATSSAAAQQVAAAALLQRAQQLGQQPQPPSSVPPSNASAQPLPQMRMWPLAARTQIAGPNMLADPATAQQLRAHSPSPPDALTQPLPPAAMMAGNDCSSQPTPVSLDVPATALAPAPNACDTDGAMSQVTAGTLDLSGWRFSED